MLAKKLFIVIWGYVYKNIPLKKDCLAQNG